MSASDHLNGQQLAMFMPAGKLRHDIEPGDFTREDAESRWHGYPNKLSEAKSDDYNYNGRTLYADIERNGIKSPVSMFHKGDYNDPTMPPKMGLSNGHHRVAVANDIDPTMEVPVTHRQATNWDQDEGSLSS